eukprot:CAMPEP_0202485920 /NCGR_PEP_ID=MMETSP1361-20130828/4611_1 /ASSEMBLY_ACC=CAM_ASM_000849 /TAXON_ID=210615 /ORGANISM="Staurosira complex sp., Strain CCMP2646" /LENGTH=615 /DNA_ID=CAMNT_0049114913 /DNA_START=232 /DNA_END=2079 /DNA_ORIENTATION=+
MGTYLSTPITTKSEESGEALDCPAAPLVWGVVDMQGWRKFMEDSHVAQTDVEVPPHLQTDQDHFAKVFGVFDGHGGAEVARFTQLYLVDVLTKQPTWVKAPETDDHVVSPVGQALVDTFHALDRMIDQPERRDELIRLRTNKLQPGERKTVGELGIPPEKVHHSLENVTTIGTSLKDDNDGNAAKPASTKESGELTESTTEEVVKNEPLEEESKVTDTVVLKEEQLEKETQITKDEPVEEISDTTMVAKEENGKRPKVDKADAAKANESDVIEAGEKVGQSKEVADETPFLKEEQEIDAAEKNKDSETVNGTTYPTDDAAKEDDDSDVVVGKEDAAKLDQDLMVEDSDEKEDSSEATNRKVTVMFQKLLSLGGNSGQVSVKLSEEDAAEQADAASTAETSAGHIIPTIIQNGRQICNLPDHPVHAGCTAIVAVLIGRKLTIANAGDSRAVLCRAGGRAEALSFDHKPQQDREMSRIRNAGGFVNQFGRVNGNLNLSRSIGDLKYKQVPGIGPECQMITAEPDIVEVYLQSNDEFFILACDGIWDCLTNIQAIKYVRERIDTMSPTEIGAKMLDEIISDDPRATQGIGGDNMTILIVDLLPGKRSYRNKTSTGEDK